MDDSPTGMGEGLLQRNVPWAAEFHHPRGRGRVALAGFAIGSLFGAAAFSTAGAVAQGSLPLPFAVYLMLLACFHLGAARRWPRPGSGGRRGG